MKYFRVRPQYDNRPLFKVKGNRLINDGEFLIGNELFTEKEKEKLFRNHKIGINHHLVFEEVFIPRTRTYTMFGARFQIGAT